MLNLKWLTDFTYKIEDKAVKSNFIYKIASGYYHDVIAKEATLANITEKDHILCIGGGICPFSAILFHQITGAKVTVIDNNEICIPKAKQVIQRLGLNQQVHVLCQDGRTADISFSDYTIIHFALQVSPMEQVFDIIERQVMSGTRLLIRRPKKRLKNMYCKVAKTLLSYCPYVAHKSRNIGSTVLYIKQDEAGYPACSKVAV